jgi:hypothetical protein
VLVYDCWRQALLRGTASKHLIGRTCMQKQGEMLPKLPGRWVVRALRCGDRGIVGEGMSAA